jgi:hypothetical protein
MPTASGEVIRKFRKRLETVTGNHKELMLAVAGKRRQASLESTLSEQFALNATVLWELFISELLMAYVSEDPRHYLQALRARMEQSVKERFGSAALKCMHLDLPSVVAPDKVAAWLDPKDFNLTVKSADALAVRANATLAAQHARKFTLERDNSDLFNYILALRNYLAHRSDASRRQLQRSAATLGGANSELNAPIRTIGPYLKERISAGNTRATLVADRLSALAEGLT